MATEQLAISVPPLGPEDAIPPREAPTELTERALHDSQAGTALRNTEMSFTRKVSLPSGMALDRVSQHPKVARVQSFPPSAVSFYPTSLSSHVSSLLKYMGNEVHAFSEPTPGLDVFGGLPSGISSLFRSGSQSPSLLLLGVQVT